jgi:hypothetical protein
MARGAAQRDLQRRSSRGWARTWGERRFSRRVAVGSAGGAVVAASALRHVPVASAADCTRPCLQDAANDFAKSSQFNNKFYGDAVKGLDDKISSLENKLSHTSGKKARGKIQGQIAGLQRKEVSTLGAWQQASAGNHAALHNDVSDCKGDGDCGNPQKYPNGSAPPSTPGGSVTVCGGGVPACGELCCAQGSQCCPCKVCCVLEVTCKDCCGTG